MIPPAKTPRVFSDYAFTPPEDGSEIVPGVTVWRYV
jgi:hypothetical protein